MSAVAVPLETAPHRCPFDDTPLTFTFSDHNAMRQTRVVRVNCERCGWAARPLADGMWKREDPYALGFGVWVLAFAFATLVAFVIAWSHVNFGFP